MELLDDDDFQQLAQNPMAAQIVEQVHSNPEAYRRCATVMSCQGSARFCGRVPLSLLLFAHVLSWHWRLLIGKVILNWSPADRLLNRMSCVVDMLRIRRSCTCSGRSKDSRSVLASIIPHGPEHNRHCWEAPATGLQAQCCLRQVLDAPSVPSGQGWHLRLSCLLVQAVVRANGGHQVPFQSLLKTSESDYYVGH